MLQIITFLILSSLTNIDAISCKCVAFKLPELQDYYLTATTQAILQIFSQTTGALTAGIIGDPTFFGNDVTLLADIKSAMSTNTGIEIANNGDKYETFSNLTLSQQITALNTANTNIQVFLGTSPKVFIPPYGLFDQNTLLAMANLSMLYLSTLETLDTPPYPGNGPVFRYPSGVSTADINGFISPVNSTLLSIQQEESANGFAVVLIPLASYSKLDNTSSPTDVVNSTAISLLQQLVLAVKTAGYSLVSISNINPLATVATTQTSATKTPTTNTVNPQTTSNVKTTVVASGSTSFNTNTTQNSTIFIQNLSGAESFGPVAFLMLFSLLACL